MTDRYERIRDALAMGPPPGSWRCEHETGGGHDCWMIYSGDWPKSGGIVGYYSHIGPRHIPHVRPNAEAVAIAHHIVACDPDTIRALLAERDQLAASLEAAQMGLRYAVRVWVLSDEIAWSEEKIDEVVERIIGDAQKEAGND